MMVRILSAGTAHRLRPAIRRRDLLLGAAGLVGLRAIRLAEAAHQPEGRLDYLVLRNDRKIGHHSIHLNRYGDTTQTRIRSDVIVAVLGVTIFRYKMRARESWEGGRLQSVSSWTYENGEERRVEAKARDDGLQVNADGKSRLLPGDVGSTSLWPSTTPGRSALLDIGKGRLRQIASTHMGIETLDTRSGPVTAERYVIRGGIDRDVWYDSEHRLVRVAFDASDGSRILITL